MKSLKALSIICAVALVPSTAFAENENPCLENVKETLEKISPTPHLTGFHLVNSQAVLQGFGTTHHLQGIQRLRGDKMRWLATGNPNGEGVLATIDMPSAEALSLENSVMSVIPFQGVAHMGGISLLGDVAAFPIHVSSEYTYKASKILFFDYSDADHPKQMNFFIDRPLDNQSDGSAALGKLPSGQFLVAAGSRRTPIDFYLASAKNFDSDPEFRHIQKVVKDSQGNSFQIFQNLSIINQCDGKIFLAGTRRGGHIVSWSGKNVVDLFEIKMSGESVALDMVYSKELPAKGICDFDSAAGLTVIDNKHLEIYCTQFLNKGSDEGHGACPGGHSMEAAIFKN